MSNSLQPMDSTVHRILQVRLSCTGEGNGNPLQCSCLENPRNGGAWWAAICGVAQSWTRLKQLSSSSSSSSSRILEWVAYPFSSGSSRPRDWTRVSCIAGSFFIIWAMREALILANHGGHYPEPHVKMKWVRSCQHSCRTPFCHGKGFSPFQLVK